MTLNNPDNTPVADVPLYVPDKIFIKVANDVIFTPVLNSPLLDQHVVVSTLLSNASDPTRIILSKIKINESFSSNLKSVNH